MKTSRVRPWIIWVEKVRDRAWFGMVLRPRTTLILRRVKVDTVWTSGPVFFSTPAREMEVIDQLIEAGKELLPPDIPYRTSMSLADTKEILKDSWGIRGSDRGIR